MCFVSSACFKGIGNRGVSGVGEGEGGRCQIQRQVTNFGSPFLNYTVRFVYFCNFFGGCDYGMFRLFYNPIIPGVRNCTMLSIFLWVLRGVIILFVYT